jgi:stress response protein SCP2
MAEMNDALQPAAHELRKGEGRALPGDEVQALAFDLSWTVPEREGGGPLFMANQQLHAAAIAIEADGKQETVVTSKSPTAFDGAIQHGGVSPLEATITVTLALIPPKVNHVFIVLENPRGGWFDFIAGETLTVRDAAEGGATVMRFGRFEGHKRGASVVVGCVARPGAAAPWAFRAISVGNEEARYRYAENPVGHCRALQRNNLKTDTGCPCVVS